MDNYYEIRVEGHLDDRWSRWFEGLTLNRQEGGVTAISGPIGDQAALHGVLAKVRDLGLPLVAVRRMTAIESPAAMPREPAADGKH